MYSLKNFCIPMRYFALFFICIYCLGFMGVNDTPSSLQNAITTIFNITPFKFSLLFSLAAWPSCFGFINGFIIDRFLGVRIAAIIYVTILSLGSVLFLIGSFSKNYDLLMAGRVLYGLGADPMMLCMNMFILHWFAASNQLGMVFALVGSLPWIGSSVIFFISNRIYQYANQFNPPDKSLGLAVCTSVVLTGAMALSSLVLSLMYKKDSTRDRAETENTDYKQKTWKEILNFPILFWLFTLIVNIYFLTVLAFLMMSQEFFVTKYNISVNAAASMSSTFSLLTFVLSSPIGFAVDKIGRHLIFASMSIGFGLIAHGLMAFTRSNPFAAVITLSLSYTLMTASYLPSMSYLAEKYQTTTAYGIAHSGMSSSFAIGSLIVGYITTIYGYSAQEYLYFFTLAGTTPVWIIIWIINWRTGNKLNMSSIQRLYSSCHKSNNTELQQKTLVPEPNGISTPPSLRKTTK